MTTLAPERPRTAQRATQSGCCAACRVILPLTDLERIPSRPGLLRCRDEDACRERFTPRRLSKSLRGEAS